MKKIITGASVVALMATTAFAQGVVRQVAVEGASGNPDYPVSVEGSNGVQYSCKSELYLEDGVQKRLCVRSDVAPGTTLVAGDLGAVGAGVAALVVVALVAGDDDESTTTSTP